MKKLFIKTLNLSPISKNKEKISNNYTSNEKSNKTFSILKHKKAKSNNFNIGSFRSFNYPIILTNDFKSQTSRFNNEKNNVSISPRLTNEKIKQYFSEKDIKNNNNNTQDNNNNNNNNKNSTGFLQFHHRLRLYIKRENNNNNNKKIINKIAEKNAEEMFFDYDRSKNKISCFSGNNAGLLRNKVLFVKGVMDYTFSKLMIKKMNFLENEKKKIFELRNKKKGQIKNNFIFNKKIKSSYEKIITNNNYNNNKNNINDVKNLLKKKIFNGKNLVIKKLNKYDFIE